MGIVISYWIIAPFYIYESKKTNAKLLFPLGLVYSCAAMGLFGMTIDFFSILLTGSNNPLIGNTITGTFIYWDCVLAWMWVAPFYIFGFYVAFSILTPKRKWYFLAFYLVLCAIYEFYIFFDFEGSIVLEYPAHPGENVIEGTYVIGSPIFIVIFIFTLSYYINGLGFLIKSLQSTGVLRKKYLLFGLGIFISMTCAILEGIVPTGIAAIFIRFSSLGAAWLLYLAVREEPEKKEKIKPQKEVKVEGDLFRISKRPDHITEEEVSISREKKICLVCKNKISRENYICPDCGAFYCFKCSRVLIDLENACWVCETPFDTSKPSKPFQKEEKEELDVENKIKGKRV